MDIIYLSSCIVSVFPKFFCFGVCLSWWRHLSNVKWLSHNSSLLTLCTQMGLDPWWALLWGGQAGVHLLYHRAPKCHFSCDVKFFQKRIHQSLVWYFWSQVQELQLQIQNRLSFNENIFFWKKFLEVKLWNPRVCILKCDRFQCNFGSIQRKRV